MKLSTKLVPCLLVSSVLISCCAIDKQNSPQNVQKFNMNYGSAPHGFYQLALSQDGKTIYTTMAGGNSDAIKSTGKEDGIVSGAVIGINADTLKLVQEIALDYQGHGITPQVSKDGKLIVTHSRGRGGVSLVDTKNSTAKFLTNSIIQTSQVVAKDSDNFVAHYNKVDNQGNFYVSYIYKGSKNAADKNKEIYPQHSILKFDANGTIDSNFNSVKNGKPTHVWNNMRIALQLDSNLFGKDTVAFGGETIRALTSQGVPINTSFKYKGANIYNLANGPKGTVLAANYGSPSLILFTADGKQSELKIDHQALEVLYNDQQEQAYLSTDIGKADNLQPHLAIVAIANDATSINNAEVVKIKLENGAANMVMRNTAKGAELFITPKMSDQDGLYKITIAKSVNGIKGIKNRGNCKVEFLQLQNNALINHPAKDCVFQ